VERQFTGKTFPNLHRPRSGRDFHLRIRGSRKREIRVEFTGVVNDNLFSGNVIDVDMPKIDKI
jgi:hypothetical protein